MCLPFSRLNGHWILAEMRLKSTCPVTIQSAFSHHSATIQSPFSRLKGEISSCGDQNNLNEFVHYVYLGPWESVEGDSRGQREEEDIWTSVWFSQHWTQGPHPLSLSRCPSQDVLRQLSTTGKKSVESDRKREGDKRERKRWRQRETDIWSSA